jgi:hypothetical protein
MKPECLERSDTSRRWCAAPAISSTAMGSETPGDALARQQELFHGGAISLM